MMATTLTAQADKPFELNLWQGKPKVKSSDPNDTAKIYVYLPNKSQATRRAVVICPGGGYSHLAMDHEGKQVAEWLNQIGIAGIVLKYRMPHGKREVPISDAEEALRLVRANAAQWNINPNDVGIMGSSAGGHLASTIATHAKKGEAPNFQILFYPVITMMPDITHKGSHDNLLGADAKARYEKEYSNDLQVSRLTPGLGLPLVMTTMPSCLPMVSATIRLATSTMCPPRCMSILLEVMAGVCAPRSSITSKCCSN